MNKKSHMIYQKQINKFPSIPIPPFCPNEMLQRIQRNLIDTKQSDFIRRLKKSKSIMIAQKNRKQKNVLNSYFMDSRKRKNVDIITKSLSSIEQSMKNNLSTGQNQEQLQRLLFPSVHNSIKNCFNNVKKLKSKQIRLQSLHQPLDVGAYLQQKNLHKNLNRITIAVNQRQQYEYLKHEKNIKKQIQSQRQFERQKINFTESKKSPKPIYLYKSQKRLNQARFFKYNKKCQKYARNYTQQTKVLKPQNENFGGWEFKKDEEQLIMDKEYF